MKTKHLFRNVLRYTSYFFVFLWTAFYANAQCPTITDPTPLPICDAAGFTFADLNAFATDGGNGIIWYDMPTGGNAFNDIQLVEEGTYYADDNSGMCGTRASIIIDFVVDSSIQNLDGIYCSNENPTIQTFIDDALQPNIPAGGSVAIYDDISLTTQPNPADALSVGATNYLIVFTDATGCRSQIQGGSTAVFNAPADPTPPNPQEFCSDTNPTIGDLDPGTTDSFSWYGTIDANGDGVLPALPSSTLLMDGDTYYVQINDIFCNSNLVAVTVEVNDPPEPGLSASLSYCEDSLPTADFNLFDELGGTPDTTGVWSGPLTTANGHLGTVNISSLTTPGAYTFTYTITSTNICPDGVSTVTITVYETFTSGIPSANNPASFCEADLPGAFDLT